MSGGKREKGVIKMTNGYGEVFTIIGMLTAVCLVLCRENLYNILLCIQRKIRISQQDEKEEQ